MAFVVVDVVSRGNEMTKEKITVLTALEAAQGALENISRNLEGDLDRLPPHILSYKLQMVKAICDGALRKVEQKEIEPNEQEKQNAD